MSADRREARACKGCGYVRKVKIRVWESREWCEQYCTACKLDQQVKRYLAVIQRLQRRAAALRAKRTKTVVNK